VETNVVERIRSWDDLAVSVTADHEGVRPAVIVEGVRKRFGDLQALDGINLEVARGTLLALLGPNGSGKTTLVRILSTLLAPDEGRVEVAGFDIVRDRRQVRGVIGLSGQYAAVDERLTARENLELVARLYHLDRSETQRAVDGLLERFSLGAEADRPAWTYSGGTRRRLDLASSLVASPEVVFLDEPSVGLDPTSRAQLWGVVEGLIEDGITVFLTTQYLEEADQLADRIAVIQAGRVIAQGTATELKHAAGQWQIELVVADHNQAQAGADVIAAVAAAAAGTARVHRHSGRCSVPAGEQVSLDHVARQLEAAGIAIAELALRQPTLDDVFMALTGSAAGHPPNDHAEHAAHAQRPSDDGPPARGGSEN
jgi:ABC-2 type transport system ATP-binding protein